GDVAPLAPAAGLLDGDADRAAHLREEEDAPLLEDRGERARGAVLEEAALLVGDGRGGVASGAREDEVADEPLAGRRGGVVALRREEVDRGPDRRLLGREGGGRDRRVVLLERREARAHEGRPVEADEPDLALRDLARAGARPRDAEEERERAVARVGARPGDGRRDRLRRV